MHAAPHSVPGYVSAAAIFARAAAALAPPRRLTVGQCAAEYRMLDNPGSYSGPWRNERAPWLERPMACLTDDRYEMVAVMGPAQSGKSEIANNWLLHTMIEAPASMIWLGPDKSLIGDYVRDKINPMIRLSDMEGGLAARQLGTQSADNLYYKEFRGARVFFTWPVPAQFRFRSVPFWIIDDFDEVPDDIGGQGSPIRLLNARQTTFRGRKALLISSPALGADAGIEGQVALGTDERWMWTCPECEEAFDPDFLRDCRFDRSGTAEDARGSVHVACPHCGGVIEERQKEVLNAAGDWVSGAGALAATSIASFRIDGLIAFSEWGTIAYEFRAAEIAYELRQDERELRSVVNARIGRNYVSRLAGEAPVGAADMAGRVEASEYALGQVPAGVECLTAAVDIQGNRFAVMVIGWMNGLESAIVDRFDILTLADGRTPVDPARYPEHWSEILRRVMWARYPMAADPAMTMPVLSTGIDTGGIEGVSENAEKFWYAARSAGISEDAIFLLKGASSIKAQLMPGPTYLERNRFGRPDRQGARLTVVNVHQIKDILDARLRREKFGPGFVHLPADFAEAHRDELTAEEKKDGLWEKIRARNETWDLGVYNIATLIRLAGARSDMRWVPDFAKPAATAGDTAPADEDAASSERRSPVGGTGSGGAVAATPSPAPPETPAAEPRNISQLLA